MTNVRELVERLRAWERCANGGMMPSIPAVRNGEAADALEAQQAEIERMTREAETDSHNLTHLAEANAILRGENEGLRRLLREARCGMWSVARYVDLVPDGRAEAIDEVRSLSRRIDAALEGKCS